MTDLLQPAQQQQLTPQQQLEQLYAERDRLIEQQRREQEQYLQELYAQRDYLMKQQYQQDFEDTVGGTQTVKQLKEINARRKKRKLLEDMKNELINTNYVKRYGVLEGTFTKLGMQEQLEDIDKQLYRLDEQKKSDDDFLQQWRDSYIAKREFERQKNSVDKQGVPYNNDGLKIETLREQAKMFRDMGDTADWVGVATELVPDMTDEEYTDFKRLLTEEMLNPDWQNKKRDEVIEGNSVSQGAELIGAEFLRGAKTAGENIHDFLWETLESDKDKELGEKTRNRIREIRNLRRNLDPIIPADATGYSKLALQAVAGASESAPTMLASMGAGGVIGSTALFAVNAQQDIEDTFREAGFDGDNYWKSVALSIPYAYVEHMQRKALTGKGLSEKAIKEAVAGGFKNALKKVGSQYAKNWTEENAEEIIQQLIVDLAVNVGNAGGDKKANYDLTKWALVESD